MSSFKLTPDQVMFAIDLGKQLTGAVLAWRKSRGKPLDPEITAEDIRQMQFSDTDADIEAGRAVG